MVDVNKRGGNSVQYEDGVGSNTDPGNDYQEVQYEDKRMKKTLISYLYKFLGKVGQVGTG